MDLTMDEKKLEKIAAAYDSPAWWYDIRGFFILTFAYNSSLWNQIAFFSANMGPRHLEMACGSGTLLKINLIWRRLRRQPLCRISGFDYAEAMLVGAHRRFDGMPNIDLRMADAANLPYADNTFNTINIANAVHCFPDITVSLKEAYRVLKPGGTMAVNTLLYPRGIWPLKQIAEKIDDWGIKKGILYAPYRIDQIMGHLKEAGFTVLFGQRRGNSMNILARKPPPS